MPADARVPMSVASTDLCSLMPGGRQVDPAARAAAIERQVEYGDLDFRTRLLIRDSLDALAGFGRPAPLKGPTRQGQARWASDACSFAPCRGDASQGGRNELANSFQRGIGKLTRRPR